MLSQRFDYDSPIFVTITVALETQVRYEVTLIVRKWDNFYCTLPNGDFDDG